MRKPPPDKHVFLVFDGEKIQEDMTMNETDIDDLEYIEVHIK